MFSEVYLNGFLCEGVDDHLQRVQPRLERQLAGMTYHGGELLILGHHGHHHAQIDREHVPQTLYDIQACDQLSIPVCSTT